jgi:hypothetical protein
MSIDLGNTPVGTPPTEEEKTQIKAALGIELFSQSLLTLADAEAWQGALALVPGTNVQAYDADLQAIAALTTTGAIERTEAGAAATYTVTAAAKNVLDDATTADMLTTLGGTTTGQNLFTLPNPGFTAFLRTNTNGTISTLNAADFRTAISAQPSNANLTTIAALTPSDSGFIVGNGSAWVAESGATARASLGLTWTKVANLTPINGFSVAVSGTWPNEVWVAGNLAMIRFSLSIAIMPSDEIALSWSGYAATPGRWGEAGTTSRPGVGVYINPVVSGSQLRFNAGGLTGNLGYLVGNLFYTWS